MEAVAPPVALRDPSRLAALRETALLDTPPEEAFDRLTRLASHALNVPVALVSLVAEDRQFFKSCIGLDEPWASARETPLSHSFCQHAVASGEPLVIDDARETPLVRDNIAVRELDVIAYAGIPLRTSDGAVLGTFCAIDHEPRAWSEADIAFVREMAQSAMTEIELRGAVRQLEDARAEAEGAAIALRELQAISDAALVNLEIDDLLRELLSRVRSAVDADFAAVVIDGRTRASTGSSSPGLALLDIPLTAGGEPVGQLVVGARDPGRSFSEDDMKLLELAAERAAHGIHNARLYQEAQSSAELLGEQLVATLRRQQAEAANAATERRRLLEHVVGAQEEERRRIALDVHDDYLQSLTAVRMQLERLASELERPAEREVAEKLVAEVLATTERMRSLVFDLRPPALDWAGVASALRLYLEETRERFGLAYELDNRVDEEPPPDVRLNLYRIAQEAITNVRKHANASRVQVSLCSRDGGVLVTVRDDGRGIEQRPEARSFGLAAMRERAESAGGWWRIESGRSGGTTVEFWVPAESSRAAGAV
jgi:signal transduction histidine kinase